MLERPPREREWISWLIVVLWAGAIFATVPLARWIESTVVAHFGRDLFLWGVLVAVAFATAGALRALRRSGRLDPRSALWLAAVAAAYTAGAFSLRRNAEEAVHFVQYGVLGVLAFRALGHRMRDAALYPAAALVGGLVGLLDEGLQWLTPRRVWDLRDLGLNLAGASGVQLALAFGLAPAWVQRRMTARGGRQLCSVAVLALGVLGASLLNTPPRIAWLARHVPGLGGLSHNDDVMLEYGHLHEDPDAGRFRSRFDRDALARLDAARGAGAGALLSHSDDADYAAFLRRHSPVSDPFLHEVRVRLFRRDRYLETGDRHAAEGDPDWARRDWTVAFRENRILEKTVPRTLAASGHAWPPALRARLAEAQLAERAYESPVSRELVTRIGEAQVAAAVAVLALALLLGAAVCRARERRADTVASAPDARAPPRR